MKFVTLDFETASECDLLKRGAWVYAEDISTWIMLTGYKIEEDGKPKRTVVLDERETMAVNPELLALCQDPDVIFSAHNASFEQAMWVFHMAPAGYPELPPERWHDTLAVAAMKGLPMGLDALTQALDLPVSKDMDGHRLMLKLCKPDLKGGWAHHTPENIERLKTYNVGDVDAQYASYKATLGLGPSERETWIIDQRINQRGIKIDREFVEACMDVLDQVREPMTARFCEITGVKPTQREKILNWVNDQGVKLVDMKKATLDAVLDPDDEFDLGDLQEHLPYHVHEALTLRRSLASSSVAKLQRMIMCANHDGRVRYTTQYHGARTGRDSGRLIQIQNYPRGEISDRQGLTPEILADTIMTRDVDQIREIWGPDIFTAIISSLRSCIVPEEGKILVAGDFNLVEAKNLLSMAGQHDRTDQIHSGLDPYNEFGALMFKRPFDRKGADATIGHVPKCGVLGCGYGIGYNGFHSRFIPKESIQLSMQAVDTYRKEFAPLVPKFWYGLWEASVSAVWCNENRSYEFAGIVFRKQGDFLTMRLPSGRRIWYHKPRKCKNFNPATQTEYPGWTFMSYQGKKFRRHQAWHGQVTADAIQGLSRDLMTDAMKRAEHENYFTIFKVHDELVFEETDRPDLVQAVKQIMEFEPDWAIACRLRIKATVDKFYRYQKG